MDKIYLSDSGPKVSPVIYGFWRWGDEGENTVANIERIINLCLELGINTFDHADMYGKYLSEELFGQVLKQKSFKREDVVLFTKCGVIITNQNNPTARVRQFDSSAVHIYNSVKNSLKKLNTDYIDIFLLDHLDPLANIEETASALMSLVETKIVKNIGVANLTVFQHQLLASYLRIPIVTSHLELNLLNNNAITDGRLDFIKQKYSKPLAWAPLAGGRIQTDNEPKAIRIRQKLEELAVKYNTDTETIAVAWVIKLGALPIIGTLDEQRLKNAAKSYQIDLNHQDWYELYYASL